MIPEEVRHNGNKYYYYEWYESFREAQKIGRVHKKLDKVNYLIRIKKVEQPILPLVFEEQKYHLYLTKKCEKRRYC